MTTKMMPVATNNDAELVGASLSGNREAFGQIVSRYQSLDLLPGLQCHGQPHRQRRSRAGNICHCLEATAATLREPEKLRSWLCGIARNRSSTIPPAQTAANRPSRRITGRSLRIARRPNRCPLIKPSIAKKRRSSGARWKSIPEIYREPLVLFYREHQSIETVAQNLELTGDAVKQRLSRGRKLLQEQVLDVCRRRAGANQSGAGVHAGRPGRTAGMAISAKAATMGAAAKGGATAAGVGWVGLLGAILCPLLAFLNLLESGA